MAYFDATMALPFKRPCRNDIKKGRIHLPFCLLAVSLCHISDAYFSNTACQAYSGMVTKACTSLDCRFR
jgi:hypothetical protein